jgi:L-tyrosine isonitrile synthase
MAVSPFVARPAAGAICEECPIPDFENIALGAQLGTTPEHIMQMNAVLDVIEQRRQVQQEDRGQLWAARDSFLRQMVELTRDGSELLFTFPGFPFKSANNASKVLGTMPDAAERLSIRNLQTMLEEIAAVYPGGCRLLIVSDGLPFCQIGRVPEKTVRQYYDEMCAMACGTCISFCSMDDLIPEGNTREEKQQILMARYARSLEEIEQLILNDPETNRYFCGLKHFFAIDLAPIWQTDAAVQGQPLSKSALKRLAGETARAMIQVNEAYNRLVAETLPPAIRLSCHPQRPDNEKKVGIDLTFSTQRRAWGTPWQNAAVHLKDGTWDLTRKDEAVAAGFKVVYDPLGRPSHFQEI